MSIEAPLVALVVERIFEAAALLFNALEKSLWPALDDFLQRVLVRFHPVDVHSSVHFHFILVLFEHFVDLGLPRRPDTVPSFFLGVLGLQF